MPKKINTPKELLGWLANAKGRSGLIIACVIDIRGFSTFSKNHESPELAMFIKGFYTQTIRRFFPTANFAKPTGDGLFLTFTFEPETLAEVSKAVFKGCFELLAEFPEICKGDPMVNFATPANLGIGIARGPACCLHSGGRIIDYSGHFLNLAARLMDLARPCGIVVDGNFLETVIPAEVFKRFKAAQVYLRGISEETPHPVFYLENDTILSDESLRPISNHEWEVKRISYTVERIKKLLDRHEIDLRVPAKFPSKIQVKWIFPERKDPHSSRFEIMKTAKYLEDANRPRVWISFNEARQLITENKLLRATEMTCEISYIPKV